MADWKIGDRVQVEDWPLGSCSPSVWSQTYEIYKINSPDDKGFIGYCSQKSYWMRSLCGKWQRTLFNTGYMRKPPEVSK